MIGNRIKSVLLATLLVLSAGLAVAGPAVAQTTTESSPLLDQTVTVDGDDRSILVSAENSTAALDVTIYEIVNGSETQVTTGTIDATNDTTDSMEWSFPSDPAGEYRVVLDGGDTASTSISIVTEQTAGGGMIADTTGISNDQIFAGTAITLAVSAGLFVYGRD